MSKPKPKISRISFDAVEGISPAGKDWCTIEKAYGQSIAASAREQIVHATNQFLRFANAESNVAPMSDAIQRVESLRKHAQSLVAVIGEPPIEDVIREYVDDELALSYARLNHGRRKRLPERNYVSHTALEVSRFLNACELTLYNLRQDYNYWPDGGAWEVWIRNLTSILEADDLPTGARKDSRKTSPFVAFVRALQVLIPKQHVRGRQSEGGLAEAIYDARQETKTPIARKKTSGSE